MPRTGKLVLAGALLVGALYSFHVYVNARSANDWVWIGRDSVANVEDVPIRLIDVDDNKIPATEKDVLNLTLGLQAGTLQGKLVFFPAYYCYAPDLRDGLPSVICKTNGGDLIVVATDNVREILLGLEKDHKKAAVIGKAAGVYGSDGVIVVNDGAAKRQ
jgi:hypothetical protein